MKKIDTLTIGTMGASGIEVVQQIDPSTIDHTVGMISQIIILIATLIGLFKKDKLK